MENAKSKLPYLLNGTPISASGLIAEAASISYGFSTSFVKQTSVAANILRDNGYLVEENNDYKRTS